MTLVQALSILALALAQGEPPSQPPASAPAAEPAPPGAPSAPDAPAAQQEPAKPIPLAPPRLVPVEEPQARPPADLRVKAGAPVLRNDRTTRCFERAGGGR